MRAGCLNGRQSPLLMLNFPSSNSSENTLFDLMDYNYVRVLLPDGIESVGNFSESHGLLDKGDLAQKLLEMLVSATGVNSLLEGFDLIKDRQVPPPTALYPPPGGPDDRSFSAFLQCHLTALLEDPFRGDHSDSYTPYAFELPTCKGWFTVSSSSTFASFFVKIHLFPFEGCFHGITLR